MSHFTQCLEVSAHHAYGILRPELLELFAWSTCITGQMMYGTGCVFLAADQMRAFFACWLEDERIAVPRINGSVRPNRPGIDNCHIQMSTAVTAPQTDHDELDDGCCLSCRLRSLNSCVPEFCVPISLKEGDILQVEREREIVVLAEGNRTISQSLEVTIEEALQPATRRSPWPRDLSSPDTSA